MGSRSIFLHHRWMRWGDGLRKVDRVLEVPAARLEEDIRQIRCQDPRDGDEEPTGSGAIGSSSRKSL